MPKKNICDLNNVLFDTMERLLDGDMEVDRAHAIVAAGEVMVKAAKVEADFIRDVGGISDFLNMLPEEKKLLVK